LWAPVLLNVLNAAVTVGIPASWRLACIVPVFKKGDRNDPKSYRPISLLDSSVKILGWII
ncbi:hypothetical protein NDU88_003601, partial [Pleurodeles waltl]